MGNPQLLMCGILSSLAWGDLQKTWQKQRLGKNINIAINHEPTFIKLPLFYSGEPIHLEYERFGDCEPILAALIHQFSPSHQAVLLPPRKVVILEEETSPVAR